MGRGLPRVLTRRVQGGLVVLAAPAGDVLGPSLRVLSSGLSRQELPTDNCIHMVLGQPDGCLLVAPAQLACSHLQNQASDSLELQDALCYSAPW